MGKKTVKRLAILLGGIVLLGGGSYVLWAFQVERMARSVVEQAKRAEQQGDYDKAKELYRQHLNVVPGDVDVQRRYAESLLKGDAATRRPDEALMIFEDILHQHPGWVKERQRAAEVASEIGGAALGKARGHLEILLKTAENDGHLEYLMARCDEQDKEFASAAGHYTSAIEHGALERLEASERLAMLLQDRAKLNEPDEARRVIDAVVKASGGDGDDELRKALASGGADLRKALEGKARRVIDAMVATAPDDYRAYLGRGRYREASGDGKGALDDFRKALQLAPDRPEVYLDVARAEERASRLDEARQVLDKGLAAAPKAVELYTALSALEQRAGHGDRAIEALELGLKEMPDHVMLHWQLAQLLAGLGNTGKLLREIAELERLGANPILVQYLRAQYLFNDRKFAQARQLLTTLQSDVARIPLLKAGVNVLLAKCCAELGEPEQQRDAILRAYSANPSDLTVRLGYIQGLVNRGNIDEAIREYKGLLADQPGLVRLPLAGLLIAQRRWEEAERLISEAAAATPDAAEPALLRVQLLQARGEEAKAMGELEAIRKRFPKDVRPWLIRADLLARQGKFGEAQEVLKGAGDQLGDRVDLRLARARLAAAQGGPQVVPALSDLTRDIERFSREDRRGLLKALADALVRQRDLEGATRALSRLVEEEPESLQPRLQLFELALQSGDAKQAEGRIRGIEQLDEQFGRFCRAEYLAWQARGATDAAAKDRAWAEARGLLTELKARRPDWSRVPLALARLDEEEYAEAGQDEALKQAKLESAIASYRRAIELGLRDPAVVRHCIQLLFRAQRGSEALEIYSQMPAGGQLAGDLGRMASQAAVASGEYHQAEEIARKAVEANPEDFQARVWLARVLLEDRRPDKAEEELIKARDAKKSDPDRWLTLLQLMMLTRQTEKAKQVVRDAEANLTNTPLALAQCCGIMGKGYEAVDPDRSKSWYAEAREWFDKAQKALKDPDDPTVRRRRAELFLQTKQPSEAEGPLKEILARAAAGKSPDLVAWARRSLAQVYAVADPPRVAEAQALLAGKAGADADDLRVLSLVHEAQRTTEGRKQAVIDLRALVDRESATLDDRLRLARLLEAVGEWSGAHEQFQELILRADNARDAGTIARLPLYLAVSIEALLRNHRAGDDSDLAEARRLVEKLKAASSNVMASLILEVQIDQAANQIGAAQARMRAFADRSDVTTADRIRLATLAEQLGLLDAAEAIYARIADEPPVDPNGPPNRIRLALYRARHGRVKDAIDICEALWADKAHRQQVAAACVETLCDTNVPLDATQANRVIGWIEQARVESPQSLIFLIGLANLYERLGDYPKAEELYRIAIKGDERNGMVANAANNLAWLIALKGGKEPEALKLIEGAIKARGAIPEFLDTRGMIYLNAGDGRRAVLDLETALKAAPSPPKYFHLAQAYLKLKDKEKARKFLETGKSRGLPGGLHRLELTAYNQVTKELGL
jgi:tetratricopeptide (TPR) repeat protein